MPMIIQSLCCERLNLTGRGRFLVFLKSVCAILMMVSVFKTHASSFEKPLPLSYFSKDSKFKQIKLSPDGKYFAATVPKLKTTQLVIIDRKKMKGVLAIGFDNNEHVATFDWVSNQRIVYTKSYYTSKKEQKVSHGEIFAANIDGTKNIQIFGDKASRSRLKSKRGLSARGKIAHLLPKDSNHILVLAKRYGKDFDDPVTLYKVNIHNKKRILIAKTPHGNMKLVVNSSGTPVIATGKDRAGKHHLFLFKNGQWEIQNKSNTLSGYKLLSMDASDEVLYVTRSVNNGTVGLFQYNFKSKELSMIYNHEVVDISRYIRAPETDEILGVEIMTDKVEYHYINLQHPYSKLHHQIASTFPNEQIKIYADSLQDNEMVIKVKSDRNAGEFYIFNRAKQTVNYLISAKPWLQPELMMPRKLIKFKARDNTLIHGYLTLPKVTFGKVPLVVDVHGGPFGVQSRWLFNTTAQMLANNGFAVLQINFRGSGGYGKAFQRSAYKKRHSLIQHDIIDGTRWALRLNNIDDEKVCIIGGSFGGYSALMAPLIEPDLYRCAIPRFGPYDLVYQMTHADYMKKDSVSVGAKKKYGSSVETWIEQSPLTYIDKLKTPLFIVTGGKDKRVPPQSALNLKQYLDKKEIDYEWLYKEKEGHGFKNPSNKLELYERSLEFLSKHLK